MKGYKLLKKDLTAHGGFQYEINKPIVFEEQPILCGENCLHFYDDPYLAVIFNPIHSNIKNPIMFECDTLEGLIVKDKGIKFGSNQLVITKEVEIPQISLVSKITFGILCAKKVCSDNSWNKWADKWLSGEDRSKKHSRAAYADAAAVNAAAANAADAAAVNAADAAAAVAFYTSDVLDFKSIMQEALLIK